MCEMKFSIQSKTTNYVVLEQDGEDGIEFLGTFEITLCRIIETKENFSNSQKIRTVEDAVFSKCVHGL